MAFGCNEHSSLYTSYDFLSCRSLYIQGPLAQERTCFFDYQRKLSQDDFNYSIKTMDMIISDTTLSFDDISCLASYFTEDNYYDIDIDYPFEFSYTAGTKTQLINALSMHTDISQIVYCLSDSHYFDDGSTSVKITITPDYAKKIVHITIETLTSKHSSYFTLMNAGITALTAGTIYSLYCTQK